MNQPTQQTYTKKKLFKATFIALALALVVLVLIVLPAEYNIDPTGFGKQIGLTALAQPNTAAVIAADTTIDTTNSQKDTVVVEVPANSGVEYKFYLAQFKKLQYHWKTDGPALHFDFHGEPKGDTTGFFESYSISNSQHAEGTATLPFAGSHGWYWRNDSDQNVFVTLSTQGDYTIIGNPNH